jgi:hypothetical protein
MGRRDFLRLGMLGAGLVVSQALPARRAEARPTPLPQRTTVYRLSTHSRRDCHACKAHAANHYFRTYEAADGHRAHRGCNCAIVTQRIAPGLAVSYFHDGDAFDLRSRGAER